MRHLFALSLLLPACASTPSDEPHPFDTQSVPTPDDGKADEPRRCGDDTCLPSLCGYDCSTEGAQCERGCAASDGRSAAYVAATFTGAHASTLDTRTTPYEPRLALDDVLIYGCDLWDFSSGAYDGLEIEVTELVHASFTVNPNDPTRHDRKLLVYLKPFTGPGSYQAEGMFQARHDQPTFTTTDGCSVDVATDDEGGLTGAFTCDLAGVSATGTFACPQTAMDPLFVRRSP